MSIISASVMTRLMDRVFPPFSDLYALINEQCEVLVEATDAFIQYMEGGSEKKTKKMREIERRVEEFRVRNIGTLKRAFATPMDREDVYPAIATLDLVIDNAKTTGREMEALQVRPDRFMLEIAGEYKNGAEALQRGFLKLTINPAEAEANARAVRKAGRNTKNIYRRALAESSVEDTTLGKLDAGETDKMVQAQAMYTVLESVRRRAIYRHLSHGTHRLAWAADRLQDIIARTS